MPPVPMAWPFIQVPAPGGGLDCAAAVSVARFIAWELFFIDSRVMVLIRRSVAAPGSALTRRRLIGRTRGLATFFGYSSAGFHGGRWRYRLVVVRVHVDDLLSRVGCNR